MGQLEMSNLRESLHSLFEKVRSKKSLEYLYTLMRVQGIKSEEDPLLILERAVNECDSSSPEIEAVRKSLDTLLKISDPRLVIFNLLGCDVDERYNGFPFLLEQTKRSPNPVVHELVMLIEKAQQTNNNYLAKGMAAVFETESLTKYLENNGAWTEPQLRTYHKGMRDFLSAFVLEFNSARKYYIGKNPIYKLPGFYVLELLVNEQTGLVGFKVHFSNGASARFHRSERHAICENISPGREISFHVGIIDDLVDEWKINGRRLCEVGLPGRYNTLGEWRILLHPGKTEKIQAEVQGLSDDPEVQGALFTCF